MKLLLSFVVCLALSAGALAQEPQILNDGDVIVVSGGSPYLSFSWTTDEGTYPVESYNLYYTISGSDENVFSLALDGSAELSFPFYGDVSFAYAAVDTRGNESVRVEFGTVTFSQGLPPNPGTLQIMVTCEETTPGTTCTAVIQ